MTDLKKPATAKKGAFKAAAAARRAKLASMVMPGADEVQPQDGRIGVALNGKAIIPPRQAAAFGSTSINIPEFSIVRKK